MVTIPGIKKEHFYEKKWIVEAVATVPPIIVGGVAAYNDIIDPIRYKTGLILAGASIWLLFGSIISIANAYAQDKERKRPLDYDGFIGALLVMYFIVRKSSKLSVKDKKDKQLRITLHRVVGPEKRDQQSDELEQLVPYIGGEKTGESRRSSIRSGIVGRAVREKVPFAMSRHSDKYEDYIHELVTEWAYTETDARKLTPDRMSWMAIPIFGQDGGVVAVVYLDSSEKDIFTNDILSLAVNACAGIATYVDERYK